MAFVNMDSNGWSNLNIHRMQHEVVADTLYFLLVDGDGDGDGDSSCSARPQAEEISLSVFLSFLTHSHNVRFLIQ